MNYVINDGSTKDILAGDKLVVLPGVLPSVLEAQDMATVTGVSRADILAITIYGFVGTIDISPDIIKEVWRKQ